jgi:hypothetical protein
VGNTQDTLITKFTLGIPSQPYNHVGNPHDGIIIIIILPEEHQTACPQKLHLPQKAGVIQKVKGQLLANMRIATLHHI